MKHIVVALLMAASAAAATAQIPAKPAAPAAKTAATAPKTTTASTAIKLPPGVPPVRGIVKTAFTLRYQEIKIGTGLEAEPGKLYKVHYTGWRAADGVKFDSSYDHPGQPLKDKDGKPVLGDDGKPKLGEPQPYQFVQGMGGMRGPFPGFDQGFAGMKIGGKRRLFIPWQLAYGMHAMPDRPDHPGIPAKSDLIFDVELVDVTDVPMPQNHPPMGAMPGHGAPMPPNHPGVPPVPVQPGASVAPAAPAKPPVSATPAPPATPAAPATPPAAAIPAQPQSK
ncbi:MAG: FKBP-type peptidyl-prolyl cis-trans isomerase [Terracidiphilus sp.]|jgi:peptidylprolyl isomerase